jgi:5-methylcytosine-specific restriction endonuclease McrA
LEIENPTLFCGEFCTQVASFVRYARRVVRDPVRSADPDVKEAIRTRMAILIGGGYPERARRLTKEQRAAIIDRDDGKCVRCGEPADEIDHIAGSSCEPSNLQLLCDRCHNAKTQQAFIPATPQQSSWAKELWDTRIFVDQPVRLCDDDQHWDSVWRRLKSERGARLWERLEDETALRRDDFKGSKMKWPDIVAEAYESNELPGEDLAGVWDDIDPGAGGRVCTEEEYEEALYLRAQMEKDN